MPPLKRWHGDSTGALEPCVSTGFTRIEVFVCESTGYTVLVGSRYGSALEVTLGLVHLVGTYGLFDSFHSDNGPENDACVLHQFTRLTGIRHSRAVVYNPNTNGIAESAIKTAKQYLRLMIMDGIARHNAWGLMLPIVQQAINSMPSGPLRVSPNSVIFASLYTPDSFVIPCTYMRTGLGIADANHYPPSGNFVTRAINFQQHVTNVRQEILMQVMHEASQAEDHEPEHIPVGSQVLIPWPQDRRPSTLHPLRRGPYIVVRNDGNVLSLSHAATPVPDDQEPTVRWSRVARLYTLDAVFSRSADDPSAANSPAGPPIQRAIECVVDYSLMPSFVRDNDSEGDRFHVRNQVYSCRLFRHTAQSNRDMPNFRADYYYEDIRHTLAFDSFIANHPALTGHVPTATMPSTWDPRALIPSLRPSHYPVLPSERDLPLDDVVDDDND